MPDHYQVVIAYQSPYPQALVFPIGSHVKIVKEYQDDPQWPNWFWCVGQDETSAWVPGQFLKIDGKKGILIRNYNAVELSVRVGERLKIYEVINGFGWAENRSGDFGWVPMRHLSPGQQTMCTEYQIKTDRIIFRQLTSLDTSDLLDFFSDDESMRYMPFKRDMDGVHEWLSLVKESFRLHGYGPWALVQKLSGQFLGYCGLYLQKDVNGRDEVELLYGILRQHWSKGYASEAAIAVANFAMSQLQIDRLVSLIEPENTHSIRIAEKVGMKLERQIFRWGKNYHLFSK